jgi:hypothetical protein
LILTVPILPRFLSNWQILVPFHHSNDCILMPVFQQFQLESIHPATLLFEMPLKAIDTLFLMEDLHDTSLHDHDLPRMQIPILQDDFAEMYLLLYIQS